MNEFKNRLYKTIAAFCLFGLGLAIVIWCMATAKITSGETIVSLGALTLAGMGFLAGYFGALINIVKLIIKINKQKGIK